MSDTIRLNDQITVGPQPDEARLSELAEEGFATIINLRTEGEDDQPITPEDESELARKLNMSYVHVPVSMKQADASIVDRFRAAFEQIPKPAYIHCKSGMRAGAMAMIDLGVRTGKTGQQVIDQAKEMGFECKNEKLKQLVVDYVDSHRDGTGG